MSCAERRKRRVWRREGKEEEEEVNWGQPHQNDEKRNERGKQTKAE